MNIKNVDLQLCKFDMNKMKDNSNVIIIGKAKTGKTYLTNDLLNKYSIPEGTIISAIPDSPYSKTVPQASAHTPYEPSIIIDLVKHQKHFLGKQYAGKKHGKFLVLDDCFCQEFYLHPEFEGCWINNRALRLSIILTKTYSITMTPKLRTNTDYIFILRENIVTNRKQLYEQYAWMFPTFEMFCEVFDQFTVDYECMVIDNTSRSERIEDIVFWYKAM